MPVIIITFYKVLNLYFHFSYLYLFLAGNRIVYTPSQGTNREKYFKNYNIKFKMPTLAANNQLFHPSLPSWDALFPSFERKWKYLIRQRWTSKCLFPRRRIVYSLKSVFYKWEKITYFLELKKNTIQDA